MLPLLLIYRILDSCFLPDSIQHFHQQQAVFMCHYGAFCQALLQAFAYVSCFVLVAMPGFFFYMDNLTAVWYSTVIFQDGIGRVKTVGEPDAAIRTTYLCFGGHMGGKGRKQLCHSAIVIAEQYRTLFIHTGVGGSHPRIYMVRLS